MANLLASSVKQSLKVALAGSGKTPADLGKGSSGGTLGPRDLLIISDGDSLPLGDPINFDRA
jgi:hypothetical protein